MNCQFCYTGRQGLLGNLSTAQIVEQVRYYIVCKRLGRQCKPYSHTTDHRARRKL